jgi:hypothetical protein
VIEGPESLTTLLDCLLQRQSRRSIRQTDPSSQRGPVGQTALYFASQMAYQIVMIQRFWDWGTKGVHGQVTQFGSGLNIGLRVPAKIGLIDRKYVMDGT